MDSDVIRATPPQKACPYCGEQILAVATKCKHCGSALDGLSSAANAVKGQFKIRSGYVKLLLVIVAILAACWIYSYSRTGSISGHGFTDADVASIEQDIRAEYSKRFESIKPLHMKVDDVTLMIESPRKLTGYMKAKLPNGMTITKDCSAAMGEDRKVIWRCE